MAELCGKDKEEIIAQLDSIISELERGYQSFPKKEWPNCPPEVPAPTRKVAHPYLQGVYLTEKPVQTQIGSKVTLDGRLADFNREAFYTYNDPPLRTPPWFRPRTKSVELRMGSFIEGCDCWKKNGLQDDCRRWDCQRPECLSRPFPECPPSAFQPIDGTRKPNGYI